MATPRVFSLFVESYCSTDGEHHYSAGVYSSYGGALQEITRIFSKQHPSCRCNCIDEGYEGESECYLFPYVIKEYILDTGTCLETYEVSDIEDAKRKLSTVSSNLKTENKS